MEPIKAGLNNLANVLRNPPTQQAIEEEKQRYAMLKLASIVAAVVILLFLAAFPSLFTVTISVLVLFVAREFYQVGENGLELCNSVVKKIKAFWSEQELHKQLFKKTYFLGTLVQALQL